METAIPRRSRERRALNMVWTAASSYNFIPDFLAFTPQGEPDLYMNSIIGFAYGHYDNSLLKDYTDKLHRSLLHGIFLDLLWLGLESAMFQQKEKQHLPLKRLRKEYAKNYLTTDVNASMQSLMMRNDLSHSLKLARCHEILRETGNLINPYEKKLYARLCFSPNMSSQDIIKEMEDIIQHYFIFHFNSAITNSFWRYTFGSHISELLRRVLHLERIQQTSGMMYYGDNTSNKDNPIFFVEKYKLRYEAVFQEIQQDYGAPLLTDSHRHHIENELCIGTHEHCHLYFAKSPSDTTEKHFTENYNYYLKHRNNHKTTEKKLTDRLINILSLTKSPIPLRSRSGSFTPRYVWQALKTNDNRVFTAEQDDLHSEFSVCILLDGSFSRKEQQEQLAAQAYIIGESLKKCQIPFCVLGYSSEKGYTIITELKSFSDTDNKKIFSYRPRGWNRDGLALRAVDKLLSSPPCGKLLLFYLTDMYPSDEKGVPISGTPFSRQYSEETAITDTESAIKELRKKGIHIVGLINSVLPFDPQLAKRLFQSNFAKVDRCEQLSNIVGRLVEQQIK